MSQLSPPDENKSHLVISLGTLFFVVSLVLVVGTVVRIASSEGLDTTPLGKLLQRPKTDTPFVSAPVGDDLAAPVQEAATHTATAVWSPTTEPSPSATPLPDTLTPTPTMTSTPTSTPTVTASPERAVAPSPTASASPRPTLRRPTRVRRPTRQS